MSRIFVLDNHDSFTWNLVQYLRVAGAEVEVGLNDGSAVGEILRRRYHGIVISPGPGRPAAAGVTLDLVRAAAGQVPLLGVCLGHQALARAWGGRIVPGRSPVHGKTSPIHHDGLGVFRNLPSPFPATRYHSLVVEKASLPDRFEVSAWTEDGTIMGIRDRAAAMEGVQFHPESILTRDGMRLLVNFLEGCRRRFRAACRAEAACGK